ncbi:MAG: acyltransferase family protein [Pseudomonadota bacterium]
MSLDKNLQPSAKAEPLISIEARAASAYRPDIDGLRAVAILPVLLFHGQFSVFSGGFVGVDVFFVVSGFLITSLIQKEVSQGDFSYLNFWERRARRLLPPIFAVAFVSCVLAYTVFLPDDFKSFGQSVFAMTGFLSNVYFWLETGYFAAPEATIPLLHSWSLSVEEQFYFLFPAVLLLIKSYSSVQRVSVVAAIAVASFVLCVWMVANHPDGAYYLLPARAWELMLGAALALLPVYARLPRILVELLTIAGLLMILIPVVTYDKSTPFPGFAALIPCLGTMLLIYLGEQPGMIIKRFLTNKFVLYFGLRSYGLYLWHWPLLVFWAAWSNRPLAALSAIEITGVLGLSLAFASLSLRFIENPIRRRTVFGTRRAIFLFCAVCSGVLGGFGLTAHFTGGLPERVSPEARAIANANDWTRQQIECGRKSAAQAKAGSLCQLGLESDASPSFLMWGDSHSKALMVLVDEIAKEHGVTGLHSAKGACLPLIDIKIVGVDVARTCTEYNNGIRDLIERSNFDAVILVGFWNGYRLNAQGNVVQHIDPDFNHLSSQEVFSRQFAQTIQFIRSTGAQVAVVAEPPYPNGYRPAAVAFSVWKGLPLPERYGDRGYAGISVENYLLRNLRMRALLRQSNALEFRVISPIYSLCQDGEYCPAVTAGRSNYRDSNHLSNHGARQMAREFQPLFRELQTQSGVE